MYFFDYNVEYNMITGDPKFGSSIFFHKEGRSIIGQIDGSNIIMSGIGQWEAETTLEASTIAKMGVLNPERHDDDYYMELQCIPSEVQLSKIVLAANFKICRELLCIIPRKQFRFVKQEGILQAVLSLVSFLGKQTRPLILKFIDDFKTKVTILHKDEHYMENVFQLFESNPETVETTSPEERALCIKYMINSKSIEETSQVIKFYIRIFALYINRCMNLDSEQKYKIWYKRQRKSCEDVLKFKIPLDKFIPFHIVNQFRLAVGIVPEFMSLMINILVSSKDEHEEVTNILSMLEMPNVRCIEAFLDTPNKTLAHLHKGVLDNLLIYLQNQDEIVSKYGADKWKYFQHFEPYSNLFSKRQLPYLSYAAYLLAQKENRASIYYNGNIPMSAEILKTWIKRPLSIQHHAG